MYSLDAYKINTETDYEGKDCAGLPDVPALSSTQLKERFDALVKDVVVPKYNGLVESLNSSLGGIGGAVLDTLTASYVAGTNYTDVSGNGALAHYPVIAQRIYTGTEAADNFPCVAAAYAVSSGVIRVFWDKTSTTSQKISLSVLYYRQ